MAITMSQASAAARLDEVAKVLGCRPDAKNVTLAIEQLVAAASAGTPSQEQMARTASARVFAMSKRLEASRPAHRPGSLPKPAAPALDVAAITASFKRAKWSDEKIADWLAKHER